MSYSIKPEEHELRQAKQIVEEAIATCKTVEEKEKDFEISLGWLFPPPEIENPSGASGASGDREFIYLEFNSTVDDWKNDLRPVTAYSYGRSLFAERMENEVQFGWQELLMEAFALQFLDRVYEDTASENLEWSKSELEDAWPQVRESLDEEAVWFEADDPIWSTAYYIGQELLEAHDLNKLPELKRSDVIEAGDRIFG